MRLVAAGLGVRYAAETTALGEMPVTLKQTESQNIQWERGRVQMRKSLVSAALSGRLARRTLTDLVAVAHQGVPFPVPAGITVLTAIASVPARPAIRELGLATLLGQIAYALAGVTGSCPLATNLPLEQAPVYISWSY